MSRFYNGARSTCMLRPLWHTRSLAATHCQVMARASTAQGFQTSHYSVSEPLHYLERPLRVGIRLTLYPWHIHIDMHCHT
jgi:hypothetical protein